MPISSAIITITLRLAEGSGTVLFTVKLNVHDCPPKLTAKLAVPDVTGVPEIVYTKLPEPLANVPDCKVAVNPVTPVDEMEVPDVYDTPLPPVYGKVAVALYALFANAVAEYVAVPHAKVETVGEMAELPTTNCPIMPSSSCNEIWQ